MSRRTSSLLAGLGLAALLGLAACATPAGGTSPEPTDAPTGPVEIELDAAWLDDGRAIAIVTEGSSTCVPTADEPTLDGTTLQVTLVEPPADTPCTMDLVPRATLVMLPEGVDPAAGLTVEVTGEGYFGDVELAGVEGLGTTDPAESVPSAGWTSTKGQLVFLTWGSSSCPPLVHEVQATGPAEVTVTLMQPPADQICTADFAPRVNLVQVEGVETPVGAQLVLTGTTEFSDVRVPIVGTN